MTQQCRRCGIAYDNVTTYYCAYCDLILSQKNTTSRTKKNKQSEILKYVATIVYVIATVLLFLALYHNKPSVMDVLGYLPSYLSALFVGHHIMRKSDSLKILTGEHLISNDPRKPILYLRSFKRDKMLLVGITERVIRTYLLPTYDLLTTYEEELVKNLFIISPVISIKNPKEKSLGAAPIFPKKHWKEKVISLSKSSRYIIIMLDKSPGVLWEIKTIVSNISLSKVVFIIPVTSLSSWSSFRVDYNYLRKEFDFLPEINIKTAAIIFNKKDGIPETVQSRYNTGKSKIETIVKKI